jgi:hypothetical protein
MYQLFKERELYDLEEAECYLSEFIFEEIMLQLKVDIDYNPTYRDMDWFYEITHKLKTEE